MGQTKDTLCWSCSRVTECEWGQVSKPVPGWVATPTIIRQSNCPDIKSFLVQECPKYKRLQQREPEPEILPAPPPPASEREPEPGALSPERRRAMLHLRRTDPVKYTYERLARMFFVQLHTVQFWCKKEGI